MGAFLPASAGPSGGDRERFSRACGAPSWRKAQPRRKQLRNAVSSADEPDLLLRARYTNVAPMDLLGSTMQRSPGAFAAVGIHFQQCPDIVDQCAMSCCAFVLGARLGRRNHVGPPLRSCADSIKNAGKQSRLFEKK